MSRTIRIAISLLLLVTGALCVAQAQLTNPTPEHVLDTLRSGHPRLMMTDDAFDALKQRLDNGDATLQRYLNDVVEQAGAVCEQPALRHELIGPRLLHVSHACVDRIYTLGLAWRFTKDERYAKKAVENLLTVCAFPDWNPSHFLDTSEMSHGVGIGYDWFYDYLDEPTRERIKTGLIELGMKPGLKAYEDEAWWVNSEFNWNQVCHGGLIAGALAIADEAPEQARAIVAKAVEKLPIALRSYNPDGVWEEGPGYWHYATRYTAYGLTALQTALGTDFGLTSLVY